MEGKKQIKNRVLICFFTYHKVHLHSRNYETAKLIKSKNPAFTSTFLLPKDQQSGQGDEIESDDEVFFMGDGGLILSPEEGQIQRGRPSL